MKIVKLFLAEVRQTKYLLTLFILLMLLILLSFSTALPSELIKNSTKEIQMNIGVSMDEQGKELDLLKNAVDDQKIIDSLVFLSPDEGKKQIKSGKLDIFLEVPENVTNIIYGNEQGIIKIYTKNVLLGTLLNQFLSETVQTFNQLQGYSLAYYDLLKQEISSSDEIQKMSFQFDLELMSRLLNRGKLTEIKQGINQYVLQLFSLLLFLTLASIGVFNGIVFSLQKTSGTLKKIRFYQFNWLELLKAKFLLSLLMATPFLISFYWLSVKLEQPLNSLILFIYTIWLLFILNVFNLYISHLISKNQKSFNLFLLLASFVLFFMFTGGLVYPIYNQPLILTLLNPAWLTQLIIQDSALNQISWFSLIPFTLIGIFCYIRLKMRWYR